MTDVYIHGIEALFSNDRIENDKIEDVLERIEGQPSRFKAMILRKSCARKRSLYVLLDAADRGLAALYS